MAFVRRNRPRGVEQGENRGLDALCPRSKGFKAIYEGFYGFK